MIHPRALVDPKARLAEDVTIGPFAVIGANVEIGAGTEIGAHVVVEGPTVIGRNNRIFPYASVGLAPQDKKFAGEPTRLVIGDGNMIRECCTLNRGTAQDRGETAIGSDNWIMAYVHIAHDCVIANHAILANNVTMGGHVHIGDWAILGGFSKIHQFCRLGAHCFTQMDCGIGKDVPPYVMAAGMPARPRGINSEGLGRRGFTRGQIQAIKDAYRILYRSGLRLVEARKALEQRARDEPVLAPFVEFFKTSERSIIR
ncbi:MAG: acyl-ACP--UDP-N-acetylglucosamine O-acyltransferase [Gammaproteobacteria bacterium]|nr:acyl-ACP--UDP-N-acetylglucosamine O-acyltransferase [Gammaproteobacteria bacterium]